MDLSIESINVRNHLERFAYKSKRLKIGIRTKAHRMSENTARVRPDRFFMFRNRIRNHNCTFPHELKSLDLMTLDLSSEKWRKKDIDFI